MKPLAGQGAIVTGASGGVGAAVAFALASDGAAVMLVGRNESRLEAATAKAATEGVALAHRADLTIDAEVRGLADRAARELPGVDVLVHAAAVIEVSPVENASLDHLDLQYRTNVRAPYALTQRLLASLREREGQVVFLNSTAGRSAQAGSSQYAASKHALTAVADALRAEVNPRGIRVVSLFLGSTATPMQAALQQKAGREYRPDRLIQPEDVAGVLAAVLRVPRTAEITDIVMRPMRKPG